LIDSPNSELSTNKHVIDCANKTLKSKEKEIHNLESKINNQQDRIQRIKEDLGRVKNVKLKADKLLNLER
jgi:predicted RNase H-like nuclease (RuvC/YqgF family)